MHVGNVLQISLERRGIQRKLEYLDTERVNLVFDVPLAELVVIVGDRTPRELQDTYVRGGAALIEYLEADDHFAFTVLPWPDYFGKAPDARIDGFMQGDRNVAAHRHVVAEQGTQAAHRGQPCAGDRWAGVPGQLDGIEELIGDDPILGGAEQIGQRVV